MNEQKYNVPVKMEFTVESIQKGIEYWLNNVVIKENIVISEVIWNSNTHTFTVSLVNGIQVGVKL